MCMKVYKVSNWEAGQTQRANWEHQAVGFTKEMDGTGAYPSGWFTRCQLRVLAILQFRSQAQLTKKKVPNTFPVACIYATFCIFPQSYKIYTLETMKSEEKKHTRCVSCTDGSSFSLSSAESH